MTLQRLDIERAAIDKLQSATSWLKGASWGFHKWFFIKTRCRYRGSSHNLSSQNDLSGYISGCSSKCFPTGKKMNGGQLTSMGEGGELCLEWGPDNWLP